jgi:hypothetical protein
LDIFGDFLYVLRLDKWGYIGYNPGDIWFYKKEIRFDKKVLGFGNWVGLNWTLRSALSKVLHNPFPSIFLHPKHKIILSVIYYCG